MSKNLSKGKISEGMQLLLLALLVLLYIGYLVFRFSGNPDELDKARQEQACKDFGGVYEYKPMWQTASCRDGSRQPNPEILLPEFYPSN